jgi:hypothetical protein
MVDGLQHVHPSCGSLPPAAGRRATPLLLPLRRGLVALQARERLPLLAPV